MAYGTVLQLTAPLPRHYGTRLPSGEGQPWAFDLSTAEKCGFESGATKGIGDLRLNYGCSPLGSIYGDVNRSGKQWTVLLWRGIAADTPARSQLETVALTAAWF